MPISSFLGDYTNLDKLVFNLQELVRPHMGRWDAFITSSMSGIFVALPLASNMGLPLVVVRYPVPPGKRAVVSNITCAGSRCCYVDDLIDTGAALQRCREALKPLGMTVVAAALYTDLEYRML